MALDAELAELQTKLETVIATLVEEESEKFLPLMIRLLRHKGGEQELARIEREARRLGELQEPVN